jgi:hypothetical protein
MNPLSAFPAQRMLAQISFFSKSLSEPPFSASFSFLDSFPGFSSWTLFLGLLRRALFYPSVPGAIETASF